MQLEGLPSADAIPAAEFPSSPSRSPQPQPRRQLLDLERWRCLARPQYARSCSVSSLVSVWNFLYSTLGPTGRLPPLTQERALRILGFEPPFGKIRFGSFAGNRALLRWFSALNVAMGCTGTCGFFLKLLGDDATHADTERDLEGACARLLHGLRTSTEAFVYHCHNHYFLPIGYELTPNSVEHVEDSCQQNHTVWIAIGDTSRAHPPVHFKRWTDILLDLRTIAPNVFDIRREHLGVYNPAAQGGEESPCSDRGKASMSPSPSRRDGAASPRRDVPARSSVGDDENVVLPPLAPARTRTDRGSTSSSSPTRGEGISVARRGGTPPPRSSSSPSLSRHGSSPRPGPGVHRPAGVATAAQSPAEKAAVMGPALVPSVLSGRPPPAPNARIARRRTLPEHGPTHAHACDAASPPLTDVALKAASEGEGVPRSRHTSRIGEPQGRRSAQNSHCLLVFSSVAEVLEKRVVGSGVANGG